MLVELELRDPGSLKAVFGLAIFAVPSSGEEAGKKASICMFGLMQTKSLDN